MKRQNTSPDVVGAIKQFRYILGLREQEIIPAQLYRLTTCDRAPAIQNDPNGHYFGLFGAEIIELLKGNR